MTKEQIAAGPGHSCAMTDERMQDLVPVQQFACDKNTSTILLTYTKYIPQQVVRIVAYNFCAGAAIADVAAEASRQFRISVTHSRENGVLRGSAGDLELDIVQSGAGCPSLSTGYQLALADSKLFADDLSALDARRRLTAPIPRF
jgi:hypothetical protein